MATPVNSLSPRSIELITNAATQLSARLTESQGHVMLVTAVHLASYEEDLGPHTNKVEVKNISTSGSTENIDAIGLRTEKVALTGPDSTMKKALKFWGSITASNGEKNDCVMAKAIIDNTAKLEKIALEKEITTLKDESSKKDTDFKQKTNALTTKLDESTKKLETHTQDSNKNSTQQKQQQEQLQRQITSLTTQLGESTEKLKTQTRDSTQQQQQQEQLQSQIRTLTSQLAELQGKLHTQGAAAAAASASSASASTGAGAGASQLSSYFSLEEWVNTNITSIISKESSNSIQTMHLKLNSLEKVVDQQLKDINTQTLSKGFNQDNFSFSSYICQLNLQKLAIAQGQLEVRVMAYNLLTASERKSMDGSTRVSQLKVHAETLISSIQTTLTTSHTLISTTNTALLKLMSFNAIDLKRTLSDSSTSATILSAGFGQGNRLNSGEIIFTSASEKGMKQNADTLKFKK